MRWLSVSATAAWARTVLTLVKARAGERRAGRTRPFAPRGQQLREEEILREAMFFVRKTQQAMRGQPQKGATASAVPPTDCPCQGPRM